MKILLIDVNYKHSSTGKIVYDLSESLKSDGYTSKVLYGRGDNINDESAYRVAPSSEVFFHAAMTRITGLVGNYSFLATKNVIEEIKKFKPDVVHLHELHGYYINIESIVNYLSDYNIPVVWTFHCEFMYTGKCGHAYECEQWKTECRKCPQLKEYPASLYLDFTNYMFNKKKQYMQNLEQLYIVTPSQWLANRVKESFLKNKFITVIPNGIETSDIFYPRDYKHLVLKHSLKDKKVILAIAPDIMDERKGGKWVLEIAKRFTDDYCFIMIGVEDDLINVPNNVITIKRTNNQHELAEYYSVADLLLLTSVKETFSLVTAESLACGTPVVGFDSGAPKEVAPKGYGRFVDYGDIDSLSNIIIDFYSKKLNLHDSNECRRFAVSNYSKDKMYLNYLNLYKHIVKKDKHEVK